MARMKHPGARSLLATVLALGGCAGSTPSPAAGPVWGATLGGNGRIVVTTAGQVIPLDVVVRLADGTEHPLSAMNPMVAGNAFLGHDPAGIDLRVERSDVGASAVAFTWTVQGTVTLQGVELRSPVLTLPSDTYAVVEGAQSWSFAGPLALAPDTLLPRDASGTVNYPTAPGSPLDDVAGRSVFRGDLLWSGGGLSVCSAAPYDRWAVVSVERPGTGYVLRVTQGILPEETQRLAAGPATGRVVLAPADSTTPFACQPAAPPPARTRGAHPFPRGWWSWNTLFTAVTSDQVLAQVTPLQTLDPHAGHLTVDDGWERAWGDWQVRDGWGLALDTLATRLAAQQLTLGLWLAPFAVDPTAPVALQHPDWLLHDTTGAVLTVDLVPGHGYHILDATHPDALAWLTGLFADLRGRGVRLFKIDYLYAATIPAVRHDPTATGLQAYQRGLAAIAAGAGDAHLNGCGAVILPAVPFLDSVRVGADNTFSGIAPFWGSVVATARNLATRAGLNALGVVPDPDQPVVRGYTPDEAASVLALGALAGPAMGYGDDLTALTDAQRAYYTTPWRVRLRDGVREPLRALDLGAVPGGRYLPSPVLDNVLSRGMGSLARAPSLYESDLADGTRVVVVLNATEAPADLGVPVTRFAPGHLPQELVAGDTPHTDAGRYVVTVPSHGVRILAGSPP